MLRKIKRLLAVDPGVPSLPLPGASCQGLTVSEVNQLQTQPQAFWCSCSHHLLRGFCQAIIAKIKHRQLCQLGKSLDDLLDASISKFVASEEKPPCKLGTKQLCQHPSASRPNVIVGEAEALQTLQVLEDTCKLLCTSGPNVIAAQVEALQHLQMLQTTCKHSSPYVSKLDVRQTQLLQIL